MNPQGLCRKLRISEPQLSKICRHLGLPLPDSADVAYTPAQVERLQTFVARRRSAAGQQKQPAKQKQVAGQPAKPGNAAPVPATTVARSNSTPAQTEPKAAVNLPAETAPAKVTSTQTVVSTGAVEPASTGRRVWSYIIDMLITFLLMPFVFVPILGQIFFGVLLALFWLFRDAAGASPGKLLLGMRVVHNSGDEYRVRPRIMRNLTLFIGPLLFAIPILGYFIGIPVCLIMILTEITMLLTTGRRLGDRLGDTTVNRVPKAQLAVE